MPITLKPCLFQKSKHLYVFYRKESVVWLVKKECLIRLIVLYIVEKEENSLIKAMYFDDGSFYIYKKDEINKFYNIQKRLKNNITVLSLDENQRDLFLDLFYIDIYLDNSERSKNIVHDFIEAYSYNHRTVRWNYEELQGTQDRIITIDRHVGILSSLLRGRPKRIMIPESLIVRVNGNAVNFFLKVSNRTIEFTSSGEI
jgi:hypothetical protein